MRTLNCLVSTGIALTFLVASGRASSIFILPSSSSAYLGYPQTDAIDGNFTTDYASNGLGTSTHLDFSFGTPVTFNSIMYTDRTSSGGDNGSDSMGTYDFVTEFEYIFATDINFTNVVATVEVPHPVPAECTGNTCPNLSDFQVTTTLEAPITAEYVKWQVIQTNPDSPSGGLNPGAAEFSFNTSPADTATPEPGPLTLIAAGGLAFAVGIRRRHAR
jgi:MYXO-CTERM domain-containing protein